jgi:hypothetical protein
MKLKKAYTQGLLDRVWHHQSRRLIGRVADDDIPRIKAFFDCSVRRVYIKTSTDDETFARRTLPADLPKVDHVVDWLASGVLNGDDWVLKTDAEGRPKKLMKCGTLEALYREAEAWMKISRQQLRVALDPAEEEMFMELSEGWSIVMMKTEGALDRESSIMQNCVGEGSYDRLLTLPATALLSLRDRSNNPHVTIHLDLAENRLYEVRGKANLVPKRAYLDIMRPFFREHGYWQPDGASTFYIDSDGNALLANELKPGMRVRQIGSTRTLKLEELPPGLVIGGGIDLRGIDLDNAFRSGLGGLVIEGTAVLSHTHVRTMPTRHGFRGDIDMTGSDVSAFQEGFRCQGNLKLKGNGKLRSLPELLMVKGDLVINDAPLSVLPSHMSVGGNLVIRGTDIRKIPPTVRVGGNVSISRF